MLAADAKAVIHPRLLMVGRRIDDRDDQFPVAEHLPGADQKIAARIEIQLGEFCGQPDLSLAAGKHHRDRFGRDARVRQEQVGLGGVPARFERDDLIGGCRR